MAAPYKIAGDIIPDGPNKFSMGLKKLNLDYWLIKDDEFDSQIKLKEHYLFKDGDKTRKQVLQTLPKSLAAQSELLDLVRTNTADNEKTTELNQEPIVEASLLAQEDFCILEPDQDGLYRLSAACVCFPARWDLPAKLDRNLSQIHGPVPGFEAKLTAPLNRMFANLKVDQPVWRQNWSLETDTALHQPGNHFHGLGAKLTASEITQKLWLRSEYQTLRRMEKTHAIVFTIRNFIWPLTDLTDRKHRSRLKTQIETMCPEMSDYKSISGYKNAILEHLGATISL